MVGRGGDRAARGAPGRAADLRAAHRASFEAVRLGGGGRLSDAPFDAVVMRRDGTRLTVELTLTSVELGGAMTFCAFARDVTRRRRVEERLRAASGYRQLVDSTRDWVWTADAEGVMTYANPASHLLLGVPPEELVGRHMSEAVVDATEVRAAIAGLDEWAGVPGQVRHRDGSVRDVEFLGERVRDKAGQVVSLRGIVRDVTDRRRDERRLAAQHAPPPTRWPRPGAPSRRPGASPRCWPPRSAGRWRPSGSSVPTPRGWTSPPPTAAARRTAGRRCR